MPLPPGMPAGPMMPMAGGGGLPPGMMPQGPSVEQKFSAFINSLSPAEQREAAPLMGIFSQTISAPEGGGAGAGPPPPPPSAGPPPGPPGPPPGSPGLPPGMSPTGATPPGLDPAAAAIPPQMSIGRQVY